MFSVRKYRPGDHGQLRALAAALYRGPAAPPPAFTEPGFARYFDHLLRQQASAQGLIFVAEQGGELLGFVCVLAVSTSQGDDDIGEPYAYLSDLYVRPECRRQGAGGALSARAEQHARDLGARRMALKVLADNVAARDFYRRRDYQERFVVLSKRLVDESEH